MTRTPRYKPYPEYKPSGIEWLGDVPAHWGVQKLKFHATIEPSNVDKKSKDGEVPVYLCNYTDVYYHEEISPKMDFMRATATEEKIKKFALQQGDTIITKDSEDPNDIAIPTYVPTSMPGVVCGYHLAIIRPVITESGAYIKRVFGCGYARSYFATRSNGLTRYGLGTYPLRNVYFPMPFLPEQRAIAAFLDRETGKIDQLIEKQKRMIELMKERRTALISAAVTGKVDVRV